MSPVADPLRMSRLLDAGRALVAELDPQAVLQRTLAAAREVTGARYAALAILNEQRTELEQFLTLGIDEPTRAAIGALPRGRGVLGVLIAEPHPLRLRDVGQDPRRFGFPKGHPPMATFLGAPIMIRGAAWGSLYLAEKQSGEFTEADEEAAVILADWAATAVESARRQRTSERRRAERDSAPGGPMVTSDTAIAVGGETGLERVLELMVKRGRSLLDTRGVDEGDALTNDDEQLLREFAASAATAVALAQSVESDRLRSLMAAADAERSRWARELHDETLQGLGALRLLLAAARRRGDAKQTELAVDEAIEHLQEEIENLHAIISDLRPAALDELGLRPALDALLERRGDHGALIVTSELALPDPDAGGDRLPPEIESTIYRLVQEALTNVVKHARARHVGVAVIASESTVSIEVRDDGVGFASDVARSGFGLAAMRERAFLAGGTVTIDSGAAGTVVRAELPS
jgi:two-component system, NarL family, sensor histidine kinase DevS